MKFRKKPVVIEAIFWTGSNIREVSLWAASAHFEHGGAEPNERHEVALPIELISKGDGEFDLVIRTLEGELRASHGDWIICGVKGEFYPCKPDVFDATYETAHQDHGPTRRTW